MLYEAQPSSHHRKMKPLTFYKIKSDGKNRKKLMSSCWDSSKKKITSLDNGRFQPIDTQNDGGTHGDVSYYVKTPFVIHVLRSKKIVMIVEQSIAIRNTRNRYL